jgi:predicted phage terminase large subunit-like protein
VAVSLDPAALAWRTSPARFAQRLSKGKWRPAPHLLRISEAIVAGISGRGPRLIIIDAPPRHGKSEEVAKWVPTWYLDLFPDRNIILTSYEAGFAQGWGRQVRNFIAEHPDELRVRLSRDSKSARVWKTTEGGGMVCAGVGGPITGRGANLFILDDPFKNWQDANSEIKRKSVMAWWKTTARTRLEPGGVIVIIMTRWHPDDLVGQLLQDMENGGECYLLLNFPALAEEGDTLGRQVGEALWRERYTEDDLASLRRGLTSYLFNALFQGHPTPPEGNLFKRDWFRERVPEIPPAAVIRARNRGWDQGATQDAGDDTAGVRLSLSRQGLIYVEHCTVGKWSADTRDKHIKTTMAADADLPGPRTSHHFEQEPGSAGKGEAERQRKRFSPYPSTFKPSTGSKLIRAQGFMAAAEGGRVVVVDGEWVDDWLDELCAWSGRDGEVDNRIDATSVAFNAFPKLTSSGRAKTDGERLLGTLQRRLT